MLTMQAKVRSVITLLPITLLQVCIAQSSIYITQQGKITFKSEAPQELIHASSSELKGAIETHSKTFSFKIRISSFEGFNSPLQRTHFNENYMESARFPEATFKGKLIEDINWQGSGKYTVRAKGILSIHGMDHERIIMGTITIGPRELTVQAKFSILLSDHNIPIPRIVKEKLAADIKVDIHCVMQIREPSEK